jgi:hypothetical protein
MKPTAEELFEVYDLIPLPVRARIDQLVREYRREQEQCPECGADCTCEGADINNYIDRRKTEQLEG